MTAGARWALEVGAAWLMPWRAVRRARQAEAAFGWVCDRLVAQRQAAREQDAAPEAAPRLRVIQGGAR